MIVMCAYEVIKFWMCTHHLDKHGDEVFGKVNRPFEGTRYTSLVADTLPVKETIFNRVPHERCTESASLERFQ